ncbi:MAG: hypothetical protein KAI81_04380 [Candidatus Marinimicrobia bacterium]|nr:hypothetical protein [Candidatus Neomarinimicrobiota bacterium]
MTKMKFDGFDALHEFVALENYDEKVKNKPQFKKAVKIGNAPKKAVLISKAPIKSKGLKFTPKKVKHHGRMIHFTNVKNSFIRAQKRKSRKK